MWCPRHDRTYARRATCPRCKTPLVRIDPVSRSRPPVAPAVDARRPPAVEAEPPAGDPVTVAAVVLPGGDDGDEPAAPRQSMRDAPRRSLRTGITVSAAIAAAFALGVGLPDAPGIPTLDEASVALPQESIEIRPYTVAAIAGVAMRLERVEQLGQRVEATVRVLRGFAVPTLREAFFDVILDDGTHVDIDDASIRAGRTRFSATFLLPAVDSRIGQIRITGLRTTAEEEPLRLVSSIAGAWPVAADRQPQVVASGAVATIGRMSVRWTSTILWADRVEIVLDLAAFTQDAKRSFDYAELFEHDGASEPLAARFLGAREEGARVHLDFAGVRDDASRLVLFLGQPTTVFDGPWTWSLTDRTPRSVIRSSAADSCLADLRKQRNPCP